LGNSKTIYNAEIFFREMNRRFFLFSHPLILVFMAFFATIFSGCKTSDSYLTNSQYAIQDKINSAEDICLTAIHDFHRGISVDSIKAKYRPKRRLLYESANLIFDSVNRKGMRGEFSAFEYNKMITSINTKKVERLLDSLRKLGIEL
jgi:hypothetical protein